MIEAAVAVQLLKEYWPWIWRVGLLSLAMLAGLWVKHAIWQDGYNTMKDEHDKIVIAMQADYDEAQRKLDRMAANAELEMAATEFTRVALNAEKQRKREVIAITLDDQGGDYDQSPAAAECGIDPEFVRQLDSSLANHILEKASAGPLPYGTDWGTTKREIRNVVKKAARICYRWKDQVDGWQEREKQLTALEARGT